MNNNFLFDGLTCLKASVIFAQIYKFNHQLMDVNSLYCDILA